MAVLRGFSDIDGGSHPSLESWIRSRSQLETGSPAMGGRTLALDRVGFSQASGPWKDPRPAGCLFWCDIHAIRRSRRSPGPGDRVIRRRPEAAAGDASARWARREVCWASRVDPESSGFCGAQQPPMMRNGEILELLVRRKPPATAGIAADAGRACSSRSTTASTAVASVRRGLPAIADRLLFFRESRQRALDDRDPLR